MLAIADADGSNVQLVKTGVSGPWHPGLPSPSVEPTVVPAPDTSPPPTSGGMWPQTSLEEVRQAQARADDGDPEVMWQVTGVLEGQLGQHHPKDAPIFLHFLEDKLGWENYRWDEAFAHPDGLVDGDVVYVRCASGDATDRYPIRPWTREGARRRSTSVRYETVKINIAQPDRQGPGGIWVVTRWEIIEPAEQVAPPSDAEIQASLVAFLQARIDGEGAEPFADFAEADPLSDERVDREIPLLYATSTGAPYERSEFELVDGPTWPSGAMRFKVRLFTENDETVVEQWFSLERDGAGSRRLRVVFHFQPTTENGRAVPVDLRLPGRHRDLPHGIPARAEPGRVSASVTGSPSTACSPTTTRPAGSPCSWRTLDRSGRTAWKGRPRPTPMTWRKRILSDPDLEVTAPVAVTIGGRSALQVDVVLVSGSTNCSLVLTNAPFPIGSDRARLFLVDLPAGSGARVLAIATITDADSFETVLGFATPIVDSIEIHAP